MSKTSGKSRKTGKPKKRRESSETKKDTENTSKRKKSVEAGTKRPKAKSKKTASPKKKAAKKKRTTTARQKTRRKPAKASLMIDELLLELRSDDEQISLGAIDRLGQINDPRATSHLIGCLNDARYMVRIYAAVQLGEKQDKAAVDSLIDALHDESLFVRQTVAGALENIGGRKALNAVNKAEAEGLLLDELPEGVRL